MLENIGGSELLVVLLVVFLFFGPKNLPSIGRSVGKGVQEFRRALRGVEDDLRSATRPDDKDRPH
jgi:sec-independent protein translocase protein TatA